MELSVYKRQIAFGGAAAAFLAASVIAGGTAFASTNAIASTPGGLTAPVTATTPLTGTASPSALVSSLPSITQVRGLVEGRVVPAAHGISPVAHSVAGRLTNGTPMTTTPMSTPLQPVLALAPVSSGVPGAGTASSLVGAGSMPNTVNTNVGGAKLPATGLSSITSSHVPSETSGTLSGAEGLASRLPGGSDVPAASGITGKLGSAMSATPLSGVTGALPGVGGALPISSLPIQTN
jgi:hypothetical protein